MAYDPRAAPTYTLNPLIAERVMEVPPALGALPVATPGQDVATPGQATLTPGTLLPAATPGKGEVQVEDGAEDKGAQEGGADPGLLVRGGAEATEGGGGTAAQEVLGF